jgi:hypothetical protein
VDTTQADTDLFGQLLGMDFEELQVQRDDLDREIHALSVQEKALAERRETLEVRRAIIDNIGRLHRLERSERNTLVHGRRDNATSAPTAARKVLDRDPDTTWDAETMHRQLEQEGVETSRDNVRVALQRLARNGHARRLGRGRYQSALAPLDSGLLSKDEG